jgi:hypothetical protein
MSDSGKAKKRFLQAAWAFFAFNLLGTLIGIVAALPASNGQHGDTHDVASQAFYGNGTALSPPFFLAVLLGICVLAATRSRGWPGRIGAFLIFLFAGFYASAGQLGELTTSTSPLTGTKWNLVVALGSLGILIAVVTFLTALWAAAAAFIQRTHRQATDATVESAGKRS